MATSFVIACPECGKQVKVSDEHVGKRVKCKQCQAVYPIKPPAAGGKGPPPPPKPKGAPPKNKADEPKADEPKAGYKFAEEGDDDEANPYGLEKTNDTLPRCPFCAKEMESHESIICLHCGYNTRTRTRPEVKAVYQHSGMRLFLWWLPGILCVLTMIGLLVFYIIFWMNIETWMEDSWFEDEKGPPPTYVGGLGPGFTRLYLALFTLACYVPLVRFAIKRLIKENKPPEEKIKEDW